MLSTTQGVAETVEIGYDSLLNIHGRDPHRELQYCFRVDTLATRPETVA
jgi:hypothetical protein